MGAWNYGSMDNDCALDWVAECVEKPILEAIERTLRDFSATSEPNDILKSEAEAAVALLIDLTTTPSLMKNTKLDFTFNATQKGLFALAEEIVNKLRNDENWLAEWNSPEQKLQVLNELLTQLEGKNGVSSF
jgi:hypothetical protein